MSFNRALYFLTYATAFWSFLMLWAFAEISILSALVYTVAFGFCILNDRHPFRISHRVWLVISVGALALALYGWFGLRIYFDSVVNLFLYLEINKLFTARSHRDVLQIFGLTFFKALAASVSTASVLFAPALLVYMFLILAAMITVTIKRDAELAFAGFGSAKANSKFTGPRSAYGLGTLATSRFRELMESPWLTKRLLRRLTAALAFVVAVGMSLFFVIPRLQNKATFFGLTAPPTGSQLSGFTDSINFFGMGDIQQDPSIAMRAIPLEGFRIENGYPVESLLRLRGTALDFFDGRTWAKSAMVMRRMRTTDRRRAIELSLAPAYMTTRVQRMRIHMESSSRGFLFGPDRPGIFSFDEDQVLMIDDISSSVQLLNPGFRGTLSYLVSSRSPNPDWAVGINSMEIDEEEFDVAESGALVPRFTQATRRGNDGASTRRIDDFRGIYLQLPEIPDLEAVRRLSAQWLEGMDNPVEKARRIEHRLRTQYAYSLNVDFSRRTDHIRYFLEDGMAGHCEYFATAMALMLRINGIPSRVVNGYATDEWVAASNPYYLVRQEHAHSWVEAWFPNAGWVTFDPTPASGLGNGRVPNTLYRRLTRWYDMIKFQWYDKIIDYDARDQAGMVLAIFRGLDKAANFGGAMGSLLTGHNTTNRGFVGTLLAMVILVGGVVGVGFLMRRRRKRLPTIERGGETLYPKASPIEDYRELLERLQETTPRAPSLTPLEYAHQVATQSEPFAEFVDLTHRYYGARYNGHLWTEQEASRARALLRLLDAERNVGAPSGN